MGLIEDGYIKTDLYTVDGRLKPITTELELLTGMSWKLKRLLKRWVKQGRDEDYEIYFGVVGDRVMVHLTFKCDDLETFKSKLREKLYELKDKGHDFGVATTILKGDYMLSVANTHDNHFYPGDELYLLNKSLAILDDKGKYIDIHRYRVGDEVDVQLLTETLNKKLSEVDRKTPVYFGYYRKNKETDEEKFFFRGSISKVF